MAVRATRGALASLLLCLGTAIPAAALERQNSLEHTFGSLQPVTLVNIELEATRFSLSGQRGQYTTQAVNAQYAPFPFVAFRARVPSHFLSLATEPVRFGVGDIELGAKLRLLGQDYLYAITLGTDLRLPTADPTNGLGSGRVAVLPYLTAGVTLDAFNVGLTLGGVVDADGGQTAPRVDFVTPHASRELFSQLMLTYSVNLRTFVHLGVDTAHPRTGELLGQALVRGFAGGGVWPAPNARVMLNLGFPIAGPHRSEWQVLVTAYFLLLQE